MLAGHPKQSRTDLSRYQQRIALSLHVFTDEQQTKTISFFPGRVS